MESKIVSVYIIGEIPSVINSDCIEKYNQAVRELKLQKVKVINPLKYHLDHNYSRAQAFRKNLILLSKCTAVYILHEVDIHKTKSLEFKIALNLDILVLHQPIDIISHFLPLYSTVGAQTTPSCGANNSSHSSSNDRSSN